MIFTPSGESIVTFAAVTVLFEFAAVELLLVEVLPVELLAVDPPQLAIMKVNIEM